MTLIIHQEEDDQRQLALTVEVPEERVQKEMRATARKAAQQLQIPGFRKGKAPYNILLRYLGEDSLRSETVEELFPTVFEEAMQEIDIEPYGQPSLDNIEMEPLVLKFTIPLEPEVRLGDYRSIRQEIEPIEITEEAIDQALQHVRQHHQVLEPVERPVEVGDMVTLGGTGTVAPENNEVFSEERIDMVMEPDSVFFGAAFVENIVGMAAGEEKSFTITFPEDFEDEDLAGKEASFTITVQAVKRRELPELDDELAQAEGDYETLEELRAALADELRQQAEHQQRSDRLDTMVDKLLEDAELVYPPAAVASELNDMLEEFKQQVSSSGWKWEDFLRLQGQTEEVLKERWEEQATNRLTRRLVLQKFVEEERLTISREDVESNIETRLARFDEDDQMKSAMREWLTGQGGASMLANEILMEKIQERIEAILTGTAPDLDALEAEAAAEEEE